MPAEILEKINPNDSRTDGESYLLNVFSSSKRFDGWQVFEEPHINSMKPDLILLHPNEGIIIIEVKDYNLGLDIYLNNGKIRGNNGQVIDKNPIKQVENYKSIILESELSNSVYMSEDFEKYYGCIETVVYFHNATKDQAKRFCGNIYSHTKVWTKEDIDYIKEPFNRLNRHTYTNALALSGSIFNKKGLLEKLVKELSQHLQYADYNYEKRKPYILTSEQDRLAKLSTNSIRRWSGVAGSGKSLILAEKCSRALKDNNRVLVLTFNITLRHYLRDLCSQQFGSESREKLRTDLTITHFHELLKIIMTEHEINIETTWNSEDFTKVWIDAINDHISEYQKGAQFNYDYILIDEGQDFKGEWIRFLKQLFTNKGEILIVYDKSQDLFNHGIWIEDPEEIKNIGFKGQPGNLKYTYRIPDDMVEKIHLVREKLDINAEKILVPHETQLSLMQNINWINHSTSLLSRKLEKVFYEVNLLRQSNRLEDITILTTNENTGAEIVNYFKRKSISTSHVYDLEKGKDLDKRRNEKWKFQGGTDRLKISSYHSYKGWQTPNVILVLDSPTTKYLNDNIQFASSDDKLISDALFISMSRVKAKELTGEYSFTCLNYISKYDYLVDIFEDCSVPF